MRTSTILLVLSIAICTLFMLTAPAPATAQVAVGVSVTVAPPDLPVYDQPVCPGDNYIWTPGYWAWDADYDDYYWVPGTWVLAPEPGFFWTPGYWAWGGEGFVFTEGYWGPVVGFYGGINYGFGYFGDGFVGGRWDNGHFFYNTAVSNVNVTIIHNTYRTEVSNREVTRVSYNGGNGGITARPTSEQESAARERHVGPVAAQTRQIDEARGNKDFRASVNHGKPQVAATARAGDFKSNVVAAREAGTVHANNTPGNRAAENHPENNPTTRGANNQPVENNGARNNARVVHPNDIPPAERGPAPNTGNAKLDQKYQQQQEKLAQKQTQENQKLQQRQDQEHQQAQKQAANQANQEQMEQRHSQQTQALMQKHQQENQRMQQRQQPAAHANEHAAPAAHGEAAAPERKQ